MSRYKSSEGGWFKLWGKSWLMQPKFKDIGESGELAYLRLLCLANCYLKNGYFCGTLDNRVDPKQICHEARISLETFNLLEKHELIKADGEDKPYYIVGWRKFQSRASSKEAIKPAKHKEEPKSLLPMADDDKAMVV